MRIVDNIKKWIGKGAALINKQEFQSVFDHPKIDADPKEFERIAESFRYYRGEYGIINYTNSKQSKKTRRFSTVNMAKKVAAEYAKVLFNEQAEIIVGEVKDENGKEIANPLNDWIQHVLEHNDFKKNLSRYLEPAMALGGLAVRPYFNKDSQEIEFSWALADAFYPLRSNSNKISECAIPFPSTETVGDTTYYYTKLEFHEWVWDEEKKKHKYVVTNELYESESPDILGKQVDLKKQYPKLAKKAIFYNMSRPQFAYLKPAGFNNINPYSPLGLGVYDNSKNTLDRLNLTFDEFNMEIKRGRRRIAVSEMLMKGKVDHRTNEITDFFDDDEDVFVRVPGSKMDDMTIKDLTSDIRTTEYVAAINHHLRTLEMETGLSTGTFTFNGEGIRSTKTATEVVSENSQTYQSRNMHEKELRKFIQELIISICELGTNVKNAAGQKVYSGEIPAAEIIGVDLDDGVFLNKDAEVNQFLRLRNAGIIPGWYVLAKTKDMPEDVAKRLYAEALKDEFNMMTRGDLPTTGIDDYEE